MEKLIIILGHTSSGKSFLGKSLEIKYGLPYLSFGDLKRNEIKTGSELGLRLYSDISSNLPIKASDGLLLINKNNPSSNQLASSISGYPISEIEYVELLSSYEVVFGAYLQIEESLMRKRFFERGFCPICDFPGLVGSTCSAHNVIMTKREDATEVEFGKRIDLFNKRIHPFINLIVKKSLFPLKIYTSGAFTSEDVFDDVKQYLC